MLDEGKQKELDKCLDELQQTLYNALTRFADNSSHLVEIKPEVYAPMSLMFRNHVLHVILSCEEYKEVNINGK